MPDIGVDVEAAPAVAPERGEMLRPHIVAGQRERHDEALAVQREEQLAAVRVVIRAPDQRLPARLGGALARRLLGPGAPGKEIAVAHRVVAGVEGVAAPPELEDALGHAALVAGIGVDRPPALRRPADDLDRVTLGLLDEAAVALESRRAGDDQFGAMHPP